jgi:hypothetical protein
MASTLKWHHELTDGVGKCSVPMWSGGGCEAGFCDKPAYGKPEPCAQSFSYATMRMERLDNKYNGYVPGLACVAHGGPKMPLHQGDPCIHCKVPHDDVPVGPCRGIQP